MSTLNNPYQSFKVPSLDSFVFRTNSKLNDFVEYEFPKIHQGSIVVKKLGEFSEENKLIVDQIRAFRALDENWDEEGASAIPITVVERAIYWVKQANLLDFNIYLSSPGPNQEILLILKRDAKEIELIIYPDREKYVKFEGKDFVQQGNIDDQEFSSLLDWLT